MISQTVLVAVEAFDGIDAARAAAAVGRGLCAGSGKNAGNVRPARGGDDAAPGGAHTLEVDLCPFECADDPYAYQPAALAAHLAAIGFDARMRASRAVIVGAARLDEATLLGSVTFEIATRARQAGVPAYALTAANALSSFDARMLDLQVVLQAHNARALRRAGQKLAGIL